MKIAVATNNRTNVTGHLGRCRSFIVYDITDGKISGKEFRDNTFSHHHSHGHEHHGEAGAQGHGSHNGEGGGHSHAGLIEILSDCSVAIFQSGGWRVVEDLEANKIKPFLTDETVADTAVEKYLKGELEEKTDNTCHAH